LRGVAAELVAQDRRAGGYEPLEQDDHVAGVDATIAAATSSLIPNS
jgi:hypothetical protein